MAGKYAVIGIGILGRLLVEELAARGAEVLALDVDAEKLDDVKAVATDTVRLDSTEEPALRAQGLDRFDAVIVTIGDNFEATLLTVSLLQQFGVPRLIVRATTPVHKRILHNLGIQEVILPAGEAAERLATSLLFTGVLNSFPLSEDQTLVELTAPEPFIGHTIRELEIRRRFGVNIITIKRMETQNRLMGLRKRTIERVLGVPLPDTVIERGDILVVFGPKQNMEKLAGGH